MPLDTFTGKIEARINWSASKSQEGLAGLFSNENLNRTISMSVGTGSDQADEVVSTIVSVAASGTSDLDLGAALTNVVNDTAITLATVKAIVIELLTATDTDANGTVIGSAATNVTVGGDINAAVLGFGGATETWTINNGDFLAASRRAAGWAITNATADILQIVNNDAAVGAEVRVTLFGTSA